MRVRPAGGTPAVPGKTAADRRGTLKTRGQHVVDHFSEYVGEAEVTAGVAIRQLLVIEPEAVQDRRLHVVDVNPALDRVETQIIGLSQRHAGLDPAAGHPDRIRLRVVIAT